MVESASEKFQHTALLLANHTDTLCERMDNTNHDIVVVEELVAEETA